MAEEGIEMRKRLIPLLLSLLAGACSVGSNFT
jgi:hypothetical protein